MLFEYCNSKSNIPDNIRNYRLVLVNHLEMVDMYGGAKNSASTPIPRNWCAWCTRAFGIAQNRIAALACFVNHARWRLNLGKKKRGEGKKWTHLWESKRERKRERVEGRRYKRHECESLLALLFVQEAHRELCAGLYLRAPCTLRLSNFFFVFFFALRKIINALFFRPLITPVIFYRINENLGLYLRSLVYLTL